MNRAVSSWCFRIVIPEISTFGQANVVSGLSGERQKNGRLPYILEVKLSGFSLQIPYKQDHFPERWWGKWSLFQFQVKSVFQPLMSLRLPRRSGSRSLWRPLVPGLVSVRVLDCSCVAPGSGLRFPWNLTQEEPYSFAAWWVLETGLWDGLALSQASLARTCETCFFCRGI